jgi:pyrroline-5-carboxylate reductase
MAKKLVIGIIGCGNMGTAILSGIKNKYSVLICESDKKRCSRIKKEFKIDPKDLDDVVRKSDALLLAVKPQGFEDILSQIKPYLSKDKLIISIAAGITSKFIEERLVNGIKVIRTMPNLPAQIKEGITAISKGSAAKKADVDIARAIFDTIGETIVIDEKYIDAITAVSGSGPAYVFLSIELMIDAAMSLGLSAKDSEKLVLKTVKGSVALLLNSKEKAGDLRKRVTSKGGTTQAALDVFSARKLDEIYKEVFLAAKNRARELSK